MAHVLAIVEASQILDARTNTYIHAYSVYLQVNAAGVGMLSFPVV